MKILFVTTVNRNQPSGFPPVGVLAMMECLRRQGIAQAVFHNLDARRRSFADSVRDICEEQPDILGISAVVSTSYAFVKRLAQEVKRQLPNTLIVVGGNMASCAELLLRRCSTDICVLGEGERTICKIVAARNASAHPDWQQIANLAFLNADGCLINTGYEKALERDELYVFDWRDLELAGPIASYVYPMFAADDPEPRDGAFRLDPRTFEPCRRNRTVTTLIGSKGCVARCTFCHRWNKGIRYIPVDILIDRLKEVVDRYDVGFVYWGDENFGTDKRWLTEFCEKIAKLDILWAVAGMRTNQISPEYIDMMKQAGCSSICYGMESGSDRMLEVMEKKITAEDSRKAMKWTVDAGFETTIQLVLGMPGESSETIAETIEFCQYATSIANTQNPNAITSTYAQALPGTPLYTYARSRGLIKPGLDGEEAYLLGISDTDAADEFSKLNFTDAPLLEMQSWRPRIRIETNYHFVKRFGMDQFRRVAGSQQPRGAGGALTNWAKRMVLDNPVLGHRLLFLVPYGQLLKAVRRFGIGHSMRVLWEYWAWKARSRNSRQADYVKYRSLRKLVREDVVANEDPEAMAPLREGR